jgi:flagellar M-ring protein FliF
MESFLAGVRSYFRTMPKNKLVLYFFLLVTVIGGSVIGLSFIQKETYSTLFSGLSMEDASMVVQRLKEMKVPYRLGAGGNAVYVPREKVYDIRLMLASQNSLPGGGGIGFELFDKTNYGMTEFMQNINYKRAVQGELSRTINQMPEVKASRVHIAIPEKTLFSEREREVTASVFLKVKPGKQLSKDQISGIVHLVAGSVEGLKSEHVTLVDASGKILYKNGDPGSAVVLSGQQYELQRSVEKQYEESVQSMLDKFIPSSKSIVRASVELNLRKVEKVEEEYLPTKSVIVNERKSKEKSANASAKASGVPGVASNAPSPARKPEPKTEAPNRVNESEREEAQVAYEVSKSVRKIIEPFGDIKKISLALVVDGKYEKVKGQKGDELRYAPRSQKELTDIKNLVARAVGLDEGRGDKIEVLNIPFEVESFADEKELLDQAEKKEMYYQVGQYAFYLLIMLSVFLFFIRPFLGILKKKGHTVPLTKVKDVYVKNEAPAQNAIEDKEQSALANAMKDKALVGSIIREWVRESS